MKQILALLLVVALVGCRTSKCKPSLLDPTVAVGPNHVTFTRHLACPSLRVGTDPAQSLVVTATGDVHLPSDGAIILVYSDGRRVKLDPDKLRTFLRTLEQE